MFGLTQDEYRIIKKFDTPHKIQSFLEDIPINHERDGETCRSPRYVLRVREAHCIEGALFGAVCLMLQGEKPLIMNLKVADKQDYDHIVTLFRRNGYYGALSKTNHIGLRYRDPIYRTVRELALSYFHEYFLGETGKKTLIGYSEPINMRRFGTRWITREDNLWDIAEAIYDAPYRRIVPEKNRKYVRDAHVFECTVGDIEEWKH